MSDGAGSEWSEYHREMLFEHEGIIRGSLDQPGLIERVRTQEDREAKRVRAMWSVALIVLGWVFPRMLEAFMTMFEALGKSG